MKITTSQPKTKTMFSALRKSMGVSWRSAQCSARRFSANAESTVAAYPGTVQAMHWVSGGAMVNPSTPCGRTLPLTVILLRLTLKRCSHSHLTPVELCWTHASRAVLAVVERVQPGRKEIQNEQHVFAQKFRHTGLHGTCSQTGHTLGL